MTNETTVPKEEEKKTEEEKKKEEEKKNEECNAVDHKTKFNPAAYLDSFYKSAGEDTAMQVVLFFLPGIIYRLPEKITTVLDLGAGPTVYMPISFRMRAQAIYTSDYAPANREALTSWIERRSTFDWSNVCTWISDIEATLEKPIVMQDKARSVMKAVLSVNVHETPVIEGIHWRADESVEIPKQFQVVATVFCLEYSCETLEGYFRAVKSACSLVEDGGYLIQGGVLGATSYHFDGKKFKSHALTRSHITEALRANNMCTEEKEGCYKFITHDDIFLLLSKKGKS